MMPLILRGHVWRVVRVSPDNPFLIDRTGIPRVATTDPTNKIIRMSETIPIPMFDRVLVHEAAHAMMVESGVSELLSGVFDERSQVMVDELMAWFMETHGIELIDAVSSSLGRGVCVDGTCLGR